MVVRVAEDGADAFDALLLAFYDAADGVRGWMDFGRALLAYCDARRVELIVFGAEHVVAAAASGATSVDATSEISCASLDGAMRLCVSVDKAADHLAREAIASLAPHIDRVCRIKATDDAMPEITDVVCNEHGLVWFAGVAARALVQRTRLVQGEALECLDLSRGTPPLSAVLAEVKSRGGVAFGQLTSDDEKAWIRVERFEPRDLLSEYRPLATFRLSITHESTDARHLSDLLLALGARFTDARLVAPLLEGATRTTVVRDLGVRPGAVRDAMTRVLHASGARDLGELAFLVWTAKTNRHLRDISAANGGCR